MAPKGFGSENMSRLGMLKPADGVEGVKKFVVETVRLAGSNPRPPMSLGIGIGGSRDGNGEPWFVAAKDLKRNVLVVVQGHDDPLLLSSGLSAVHCSWTAGCAPEADAPVTVKTRYRAPDGSCGFWPPIRKKPLVSSPSRSPVGGHAGQSAVLYSGDVCLGGGFIETVLPVPAS